MNVGFSGFEKKPDSCKMMEGDPAGFSGFSGFSGFLGIHENQTSGK